MNEQEKKEKAEYMKRMLKPYAELFRLEIDYKWDGTQELLVVDGTEICCGYDSTYGVMREFIGYLFIRINRDYTLGAFDKQTRNVIQQYWREKPDYMPYLRFNGSVPGDDPEGRWY